MGEVTREGAIITPDACVNLSSPQVVDQEAGESADATEHADTQMRGTVAPRTLATARLEFKQKVRAENRALDFSDKVMEQLSRVALENDTGKQTRVSRFHLHPPFEGRGGSQSEATTQFSPSSLDSLD